MATARAFLLSPMEGLQAPIQVEDLPVGECELAHMTEQDPSLWYALMVAST